MRCAHFGSRFGVFFFTMIASIAIVGSAEAQTVGDVTQEVEATVDHVEEVIDGTTAEVQEVVDGTVDGVQSATDDTVATVAEPVDGVQGALEDAVTTQLPETGSSDAAVVRRNRGGHSGAKGDLRRERHSRSGRDEQNAPNEGDVDDILLIGNEIRDSADEQPARSGPGSVPLALTGAALLAWFVAAGAAIGVGFPASRWHRVWRGLPTTT